MKDLVCIKCGKVIIKRIDDSRVQHMEPGHCNYKKCFGKLEWQPSY